ncbi:NIPSNAP family protein [Devosia sp. A449]
MYRLAEFVDAADASAYARQAGSDLIGAWTIVMGGPRRGLVLHGTSSTLEPADNAVDFELLPDLDGLASARKIDAPLFEIRRYVLQSPESLVAAREGWRQNLPHRLAIKPITGVFSSTGIDPIQLLHIYPYESLAERTDIRRQAVATGHWPPAGGSGRNRTMHAELAVPLAISGA